MYMHSQTETVGQKSVYCLYFNGGSKRVSPAEIPWHLGDIKTKVYFNAHNKQLSLYHVLTNLLL